MNPILLIPARMASTRLPNKPLAEIAGVPMIVRVWARAVASGLGPVVVAAGEPEIVAAVEKAGGRAVMTQPDLPSGSDRIWEALGVVDPKGAHDVVVNLQGDLPALDPDQLKTAVWALEQSGADIGTLAAPIIDEIEEANPAVVKAVVAWDAGEKLGRALYFTRATAPAGEGVLWHHVGLYAYRREALESFVALPPSPLEEREKLEQLRALEAGMRIAVARVDATPLSVDTPADLDRARKLLS
ncbi:MAG TPA: 3-deoxy-manno-octulosonate cytidylyltransferase [Rhizomicrobium sp.]|jgi:3-deoxy-manno-octulosonate cytidylyltransferase (CMP-KDO synthetase)|nr:3-deoxy-manno-octulosonate cytidylyltransferase [Rhizomicrobium sp.]